MRVLTVKQPWADLIIAGVKDVENRTWPVLSTVPQWGVCPLCTGRSQPEPTTDGYLRGCIGCQSDVFLDEDGPFPFRLGIHAAARVDASAPLDAHRGREDWLLSRNRDARHEDTLGVLIGSVTVIGCHHADECGRCLAGEDGRPCLGPRCVHPCSRWAQPDVFHWQLADPEPLDVPVPMKGRLGLWTTDVPVPA